MPRLRARLEWLDRPTAALLESGVRETNSMEYLCRYATVRPCSGLQGEEDESEMASVTS